MAIRIPVYQRYEIIKWPYESPADRLDQMALYCHSTATCSYCRGPTVLVDSLSDDASKDTMPTYFRQCGTCGFFFARGTRDYAEGPAWGRFMLAKVLLEPLNSPAIDTQSLIRFLNANNKYITTINPFKAEDVVVELLRDFLGCEIRKVGGRKDGGVDAYAVRGNSIAAIIQVKWRQASHCAEGVQVIRSVAGTQVIKGVPQALIFTTRRKYSVQARKEVLAVHDRELVNVGRLSMDLKTYDDLLDMLEVTTRRLTERPIPPEEFGSAYDLF